MASAVKATASFVGRIGETDYIVRTDEAFAGDHPAAKKWPQFFKPVIEQATAAPGESRSLPARIKASVSKPAKKGNAMTSFDQEPKGKAMTTNDFDPKPDPIPAPKVEPGENTLRQPVPTPQTDSDGAKDDAAGKNDIPTK